MTRIREEEEEVKFFLLVPARSLVRKTGFCNSQVIVWEDRLGNTYVVLSRMLNTTVP